MNTHPSLRQKLEQCEYNMMFWDHYWMTGKQWNSNGNNEDKEDLDTSFEDAKQIFFQLRNTVSTPFTGTECQWRKVFVIITLWSTNLYIYTNWLSYSEGYWHPASAKISDVELKGTLSAQLLRSWLNEVAPSNIEVMSVTSWCSN